MSDLPAVTPSPSFKNISGAGAGVFEFNSSENLKGARPEIPYGAVWCEVCGKPCDFDESGLHNLWGKPDKSGHHRGYLVIRAYCHGQHSDISITFTAARENAGKTIVAFTNLTLPEPVLVIEKPIFAIEGQASKKE